MDKEKLYKKAVSNLLKISLKLRQKSNRLAIDYNLELLKSAKGLPSNWDKVDKQLQRAVEAEDKHNNMVARMDMTFEELKKLANL